MSAGLKTLTRPIHRWAKSALPTLSDTESEALNAGDAWWEADLFSGNPDWSRLLAVPRPELSEAERAFIDGPCRELCEMIDDWKINHQSADLPAEAWAFLKKEKFFGMIIPKRHGGLGFTAFGHSEIIRYISTRSVATAVTVMVPNSLGPGELLLQFGTEAQKDYWLPRLADGREVPAFALTSEEAGSDAASMVDSGVVCKGDWNGEEVTGIRLNWAKRYITLSPVCTVLGLAFRMTDPEGLLGGKEDIGITCALVPTDLPGVETGRRHIPAGTMFQNGPTTGTDVFVPLDHIIGGAAYAGRGWMMLMSALAAGRGISLPSLSAAATAMAACTTGAYSRIRQQFGTPIGKFGGVQEPLARLATQAYALDAARRLTCAGLDEGRNLAVISGIMKAQATYRMRDAINDAMDVHSGKAVIDGPLNYLSPIYRAVPIGITVEGANILTRNLIIFGQGAIRAHPHILDEMQALRIEDEAQSLSAFHTAFWSHVGHSVKTLFRAWGRAWTGGRFAPAPAAGAVTPIYRQMSRWSAAFALVSDAAFLILGGDLKRREMISARLGDVMSELYILSGVLKRWDDEGRQRADLPLVEYASADAFRTISKSLDEVLANFPARGISALLRALTRPATRRGPKDTLTEACAALIYTPSATRERIAGGLFTGCRGEGVDLLLHAYALVCENETPMKALAKAGKTVDAGLEDGTITSDQADALRRTQTAVAAVVRVDDFSPEEIEALFPGTLPEMQTEAAQ